MGDQKLPELKDHILLPVAVRAYAVHAVDGDEQEDPRPVRPRRRGRAKYPRSVLIIDVETRTDHTQRLTFGGYRYYRDRICLEEGQFYADDLPEAEVRILQEYVRRHRADVDTGTPTALHLYRLTEFLHRVFYRAAYKGRCLVVGFNLPFDLSRLAHSFGVAKSPPFGYGFSFVMWTYEEGGQVHENSFRPRLVIKSIDSKRALKGFGPPLQVDALDRINRRISMKDKRSRPVFRGHLLDLRTTVFALTDKSLSLEKTGDEFETEVKKGSVSAHGRVDEETIDYNRRDVQATGCLLFKVLDEYARHPIDLPVTQIFSPASIGKGYLAAMGIPPILERQPDFPAEVLGEGMEAYYGGWAETRIRKVPLPVVYLDFLSMYPTVNTLLGSWQLLIAERIDPVDVTEEITQLIETVSWHDLFDRGLWKRFLVLVQVQPEGQTLPARCPYDAAVAGWQMGVNPLWLNPFGPNKGLWYAQPDVLLATILTGRAPRILRAIRLIPRGVQATLRPVYLRGEIRVDPAREDFFKRVIEERKRAAQRTDLTATERRRLDLFLKVLANSTSYGIMAEMNRENLPAGETALVEVWGGEGLYPARVRAPEAPGRYFFSPLAAIITSAARLMLGLAQRCLAEYGGVHVMCDTDSLAIVSTEHGGLIPCPGGSEKLPGGQDAVRALSWAEVETIRQLFVALNPYDKDVVPGSVLELEKENFDEVTGQQRQLYCYAISAKRYALFNRGTDGSPQLRKWSEHGLGHLLNPSDPEDAGRGWIRQVWEGIVAEALGHVYRWPDWLGQPAIGRVTISSPHLLAPFKDMNRGKPYTEQITPFTFLLSAHVAPFGHPEGADPTHFHLFAPYTPDSDEWLRLRWVDAWSKRHFRISTTRMTGGEFTARVKTIGEVLAEYRSHPESKSLGSDGKPCGRKTVGVLARRRVIAMYLTRIGKESNRLDDVEGRLVHDLDEVSTEYVNPDAGGFQAIIVPMLRIMPRSLLLTEAGLTKNGLKKIQDHRSRPRLATITTLTKVAARFARRQLQAAGKSVPNNDFVACLASLVGREMIR